jgi:TonB family protein
VHPFTLAALAVLAAEVAQPARRVAVLPLATRGLTADVVDAVDLATRQGMAQALQGSAYAPVRDQDLLAAASGLGACVAGGCDAQVARRAGAEAFLGGEAVAQEGGLAVRLRLFETWEGALLAAERLDAVPPAELPGAVSGAAERLGRELLACHAEALDRANRGDLGGDMPSSVATVRPPALVEVVPAGPGTPGMPAWKQAATLLGVILPVVSVTYLLAPLLLVPGLNVVVMAAWLAHPFVAAGLAWLVTGPLLNRRAPLVPLVAAGGLAELAACLGCLGPVVLFTEPVRLLVGPAFVAALALANTAGVWFALARTSRPRGQGEPPVAFHATSVPPAPEEDEAPVVTIPGVTPPVAAAASSQVARGPALPYRLQARSRPEPPPPASTSPPASAPLLAPGPVTPWEPPGPTAGADPSAEEMSRTIRAAMPAFNACYDRALKREAGVRGRVVVAFTLARDGRVADAVAEQDHVPDPEVARCVVARFKRLQFPPPREDAVEGSFPFVFVPAEE